MKKARPRKSTKKRGAFNLTPSKRKGRDRARAEGAKAIAETLSEDLYGKRAKFDSPDFPTDQEFLRQ